jgi:toxin ParE1/3/4
MSREIDVRRDALVDTIEIAFYLSEDNEAAAERFSHAVVAAYERLAEMPTLGSLRDYGVPTLINVRAWPVPGFPNYLIFYEVQDEKIVILHVLHGARDLPTFFGSDHE